MSTRLLVVALLIMIVWPMPIGYAQDDATWLYNQINGLRASLGLHSYAWNGALNAAAQAHSEWMAATGIISHDGDGDRGPGERAVTFGYGGRFVSENIFGGMRALPQQAWAYWTSSSIHYAAITHSGKNEVGVGIATSGEGIVYYTLMFGEGSGVDAPPPPPQPAEEVPVAATVPQEEQPPPAASTEPPPPTRPPITFTPSPTIPSQTPTITWTPTYTWTPSPSPTIPPPTSTPIRLATAAPLPTDTEVAIVPSPTDMIVQLSPLNTPEDMLVADEGGSDFSVRRLLPIIIAAQVIGIGVVLWRLWFRRH